MSVYDQIGGEAGVAGAVEEFYRRVLSDPALAPYFDGIDFERLKAHQRAFIGAAIGGPDTYGGRSMGRAHAGLGVTDDDFDRVVGHLGATLEGAGVAPDTVGSVAAQLAPLRSEIAVPG